MSNLTDIVKVTVNVSDVRLTLAGFGTPLILGAHAQFEDRVRAYQDIDSVGEDFPSTSAQYLAAQALFAQTPSPEVVKIGRQQVNAISLSVDTLFDSGDTLVVTVNNARDGIDYVISVNDGVAATETYSYTALLTDTEADIAAALVGLVNGGGVAVTATDNGDGSFSLAADVADSAFWIAAEEQDGATEDSEGAFTVAGGYWTIINGAIAATTSESADTLETVADQLVAAATQLTGSFDALDGTGGVWGLSANPVGTAVAVSVDSRQSLVETFATGRGSLTTLTASESTADAIAAINDVDADWYALITIAVDDATIQGAAAAIEAQTKIYGTVSDDSDILDAAITNDIASTLNALSYNRTWIFYHASPELFPDAAWFGTMLPRDPGSATWMHKQLAGVSTSDLTSTEKLAALGKRANLYLDVAGVGATREGTMASGRFIDIQRSQDYMEQDIAANVALRLLQEPKVPYTDAGGEVIGGIVRSRMQSFVTQGILAPLLDSTSGELYRVTVPKVADQSAIDRQNRFFAGIVAQGQLAGAIHSVEITVNVNI